MKKIQTTTPRSPPMSNYRGVKLKACPFCEMAKASQPLQEVMTTRIIYRVYCCNPHCRCDGPAEHTKADAVRAWNRRRNGGADA